MVNIEFIRKKHFVEGWSIRKIAKHVEVSRQSVRKALKSAEPWTYTLSKPKPCPVMDPFREVILQWLRADHTAIPELPKAKVLSLADAHFVPRKENLLCLGPSGTGKTHIVTALGIAAIEAGYRVRFIRTVSLAQELLVAQQELRLNRYLKSWCQWPG